MLNKNRNTRGKGTAHLRVLPSALRVIAPELGQGDEKPLEESANVLPAPVSTVSH
jgi:hypothetical protein